MNLPGRIAGNQFSRTSVFYKQKKTRAIWALALAMFGILKGPQHFSWARKKVQFIMLR